MLTHARVHLIRTSGLTDRHYERLWHISARTIRSARVGETYADHETPPDTLPRQGSGRWPSSQAKPAKVRHVSSPESKLLKR